MPEGLLYPESILSVHVEAVRRLIKADSGDAALLYLYLLQSDTAEGLGFKSQRLEAAADVLKNLELLPKDAVLLPPPPPPPPERPEDETPPNYGQEDVRIALAEQENFALLAGELQRSLGRILAPADLMTLLVIYDHIGMPMEVILLLVNHCVEETERKFGAGRRTTMTQIKKEAFRWQRKEILSHDAAERHLRYLHEKRQNARRLFALVGVTDREPIEEERKYLESWSEMGLSDELISLAYEKTIMQKTKMVWPYMTSILRNWHKKGLHSAQDVAKERPRRSAKAAISKEVQSEQYLQDLARLDRLLLDPEEE